MAQQSLQYLKYRPELCKYNCLSNALMQRTLSRVQNTLEDISLITLDTAQEVGGLMSESEIGRGRLQAKYPHHWSRLGFLINPVAMAARNAADLLQTSLTVGRQILLRG